MDGMGTAGSNHHARHGPATNPMDLTATDLAQCIRSGNITPLASVEACLERIAQLDTSVNAFTLVCAAAALQRARTQTAALARGEIIGPLCGVPLAVKDLEDVKGLPTSHGCKAFTGVHAKPAQASSVQVARLEAAGAIVVGKTNTPIFGSAAYCKNLAFGSTKNPWKLDRTPGGSSGGSAAAVASRMVPLATAADSGGSIRIPAAFTGTFGLKPSFGRIPDGEGSAFGFQKWNPCLPKWSPWLPKWSTCLPKWSPCLPKGNRKRQIEISGFLICIAGMS